MFTKLWAALFFICLPRVCFALLEEKFVAFNPSDGSLPLHDAAILYASDDAVGVKIASESLADDLEQITGSRPSIYGSSANSSSPAAGAISAPSAIIIGTVDSSLLQTLARGGKLDVSDIRGKWETFKTSVVANPFPGIRSGLVIAGSDKRGAMFGVYTLSAQCGQSPYHWWADVPAAAHSEIHALPKTTLHGSPSVKYRGLFINDEAPALTGWWSRKHHAEHQPLDADFYRHVFDLLLRLKANFIWPAMWASFVPKPGNVFFTDDPRNQQLADDYGIVVSTSHHEPMQRATNEWDEAEMGPWDWTENKGNVTAFMEEGVRRAGRNESYFTLGMRGPSDGPIEADDPVAVLEDVFATERALLGKYNGNETSANQVWTIYKEVATYYAAGLVPPDDVTLMFTDDNWGNVQRLPTGNETKRSGGIGLYFHLEYVGRPKSYKWQNSNNLAKVYKDLYHSYERGADRIWVINVADIKPMELPFGFIMELAWNASSIDFSTIPAFLTAFAAREFGAEEEEIAAILLEHSHLIGRRKLESLDPSTYSHLHYHESERVLSAWRDLAARVSAVAGALEPERQDAFFHLVRYPVQAGYLHHAIVLGQGLNRKFGYERRNAANRVALQVLEDFDADFDLLEEYRRLAGGKWAGMMEQAKLDMSVQSSWKAPSRDVVANLSFVQLRQNMDYAFGNLGIYAEGSLSAWREGVVCASIDASMPTEDSFAPVLPTLDRYGPAARTVELFHRGDHRVPIAWSLSIPYDWLTVVPASGVVSVTTPEQLLTISIDWAAAPPHLNQTVDIGVTYDTIPHFDVIRIPVDARSVPDTFHGYPETAGLVSIEAAHFQRASAGVVAFDRIPHLGTRTRSGSIALRPFRAARKQAAAAEGAWVEYDFYLFDAAAGVEATLYLNGALDTDPELPMRYSLALDVQEANFTRLLEDADTAGDLPPDWTESVEDQVWKRVVSFGAVGEGGHTLRWRANSPEIYLEKLVLDVRDAAGESYLGPPETTRV